MAAHENERPGEVPSDGRFQAELPSEHYDHPNANEQRGKKPYMARIRRRVGQSGVHSISEKDAIDPLGVSEQKGPVPEVTADEKVGSLESGKSLAEDDINYLLRYARHLGGSTYASDIDILIARQGIIGFSQECEEIMLLAKGLMSEDAKRCFLTSGNGQFYANVNRDDKSYSRIGMKASNGTSVRLTSIMPGNDLLNIQGFSHYLEVIGRHTDPENSDAVRDFLQNDTGSDGQFRSHQFNTDDPRFSTRYYFNSKGEWIKICCVPYELFPADREVWSVYRGHPEYAADIYAGDFEVIGYCLAQLRGQLKSVEDNSNKDILD